MANNLISTTELIEKANTVLSKHAKLLNQAAIDAEKLNKAYSKLPSQFIQQQQQQVQTQTKLSQSTKKLTTQTNALNTAFKSKVPTLRQLSTISKQNEAANNKLTSSWYKLTQQLKVAEATYRDLAASQGVSNAQTKKAQVEVQKLRAKVDAINTPIKRFGDNVGNYKSALSGALPMLRSFVSAFGLTSGVYLFAGAIKDAFNRVREFDKAMQNIAGIMRVSREEIKDLETQIISVAGSSIKTSREVAELAENLVTLGKTKSEIKDLLEPVNNLAIGLETTSGEAAEFLVQTLNAFGAGSDEAAKYADTIATIRTSTTLDFQKMRDSFQYLTPISRILNKDLAYTGSVLGILADNGLKAEQAGRLLGTAQQKLAKEGRTLLDALEEINEAQSKGIEGVELLAIASDLFGKQAAKVGVILASNTDLIDKNAEAIRGNSGALDDLVNEQLKSLDAQLKILDSTWEEFILNIENGNSVLSKVASGIIQLITLTIKWNSLLLDSSTKEERTQRKVYESTLKLLNKKKESLSVVKTTITLQNKYLASLKTEAQYNNLNKEQLEANRLEQIKTIGILSALRDYQKNYTEEVIANTEETEGNTNSKVKNNKETRKIKEGTIEYYENAISLLEKEQRQVSTNSQEWEYYQKQIDSLTESLKTLKRVMTGDYSALEGLDSTDLTDELKKGWEEYVEDYEKNQKKIAEIHEHYAKQRESQEKELSDGLKDLAKSTVNIILQSQLDGIEERELALDASYDAALINAGDSVTAQAEVERQYLAEKERIEKEKAEIENKAFLLEQGFKFGEIAIDTIQKVAAIKTQAAVLAANPVTAPLAALALAQIPTTIAIGAVAGASVLAQSIPAFKDGVDNFSGGLAILGDGGVNEYVTDNRGKLLGVSDNKDTLYNLPTGATVHPNYDAFINSLDNELINNNIMPIGQSNIAPMIINNGLTKSDFMEGLTQHGDKLSKTINNKKSFEIHRDEKGFNIYEKKKGARKRIMNARYSGKGISV